MNKINVLCLVMFTFFNVFITNVNGQFADAVLSDNSISIFPVQASNTGNFIIKNGGVDYTVQVWDDPSNGNAYFYWDVNSTTGSILIDPSTVIRDPDVCLLKNASGIVYAVVAYYDVTNNQFMMRVFTWSQAMQQFNASAPVVISAGQYERSINIDAGDNGHFVIVWDEPGEQIRLVTGSAISNQPPQLTLPGSVFTIESGSMPDVCFYRDGITNFTQVDVVYVNFAGFVAVDFYKFDELLVGVQNHIPYFRSGAPDLLFRYPRIDCPAPGNGNEVDFTVVVEDSDNASSWYIKGYNSNACCPGFTYAIYNDGSTGNSPFNITDIANTRPVVTYENFADAIMVGWNMDNSFGLLNAPGATIAEFPIVLSCDKKAQVYQAANYLNVPPGVSFGSKMSNLSISGKFSTNGLFTYLNENNLEINYKLVPHSLNPGTLRTPASDNFSAWLNEISLMKSGTNGAEYVKFEVVDLMGRRVFIYEGKPGGLAERWGNFSSKAPAAIYSGLARDGKGTPDFSGKILIAD